MLHEVALSSVESPSPPEVGSDVSPVNLVILPLDPSIAGSFSVVALSQSKAGSGGVGVSSGEHAEAYHVWSWSVVNPPDEFYLAKVLVDVEPTESVEGSVHRWLTTGGIWRDGGFLETKLVVADLHDLPDQHSAWIGGVWSSKHSLVGLVVSWSASSQSLPVRVSLVARSHVEHFRKLY